VQIIEIKFLPSEHFVNINVPQIFFVAEWKIWVFCKLVVPHRLYPGLGDLKEQFHKKFGPAKAKWEVQIFCELAAPHRLFPGLKD
jgi:hypothetical protein